jgi:hypothetical protein
MGARYVQITNSTQPYHDGKGCLHDEYVLREGGLPIVRRAVRDEVRSGQKTPSGVRGRKARALLRTRGASIGLANAAPADVFHVAPCLHGKEDLAAIRHRVAARLHLKRLPKDPAARGVEGADSARRRRRGRASLREHGRKLDLVLCAREFAVRPAARVLAGDLRTGGVARPSRRDPVAASSGRAHHARRSLLGLLRGRWRAAGREERDEVEGQDDSHPQSVSPRSKKGKPWV